MAPAQVSLWINGERRSASDRGTFEVRNPLSKEVVATSASATSKDCKVSSLAFSPVQHWSDFLIWDLNGVQDAVEAAGKAFESWERTPGAQKRAIFLKAADLLVTEKYQKKITKMMQEETAATETWIAINIWASRELILEAAAETFHIKGESSPCSAGTGGHVIVQRRAHGAV